MALHVGYATDWITEFKPGRTRTSRKIGPIVIDVTFDIQTKVGDRWVEHCRVTIVDGESEVFNVRQSRLTGDQEPFAVMIDAFLPGPWEESLASLWNDTHQSP